MPRLVLDANVLISALLTPSGPPARLFPPADMAEYLAVLRERGIMLVDPVEPARVADDDYLFALAVVGRADALVSGDGHVVHASQSAVRAIGARQAEALLESGEHS